MKSPDYINLLNDRFNIEFETKILLDKALNIPFLILCVLMSTLLYLSTEFPDLAYKLRFTDKIFYILLISGSAMCITGYFWLFRAYNNFVKGYENYPFPEMEYFLNKRKLIINQRRRINYKNKEIKTRVEYAQKVDYLLEKEIIETLCTLIDKNSKTNRQRYHYLYRTKQFTSIAALLTGFCIVLVIINLF